MCYHIVVVLLFYPGPLNNSVLCVLGGMHWVGVVVNKAGGLLVH